MAGSVKHRLAVWLQSGSRELGLEMSQVITLQTTLPTVTHPPNHVPLLKDSTTSQNSTSGWQEGSKCPNTLAVSLWGASRSQTK